MKSKVSPSTLKRHIGEAERAMTKAMAEVERLSSLMAAAGSDHAKLTALSNEMAGVQATMSAAETRWLELAAEAEAAGLDLD
jgi:hypothetical protein